MNRRGTGHKISAGTLTVAGMAGVTAITSFSLQSDQVGGFPPWTAPRVTLPSRHTQRAFTLSGKQVGLGYRSLEWSFDFWTFGMMDYWLDTFLASGGTRIYSNLVTILSYDETNTAEYLTCTLHFPEFEQVHYGWKNINFKFTMGAVIT